MNYGKIKKKTRARPHFSCSTQCSSTVFWIALFKIDHNFFGLKTSHVADSYDYLLVSVKNTLTILFIYIYAVHIITVAVYYGKVAKAWLSRCTKCAKTSIIKKVQKIRSASKKFDSWAWVKMTSLSLKIELDSPKCLLTPTESRFFEKKQQGSEQVSMT